MEISILLCGGASCSGLYSEMSLIEVNEVEMMLRPDFIRRSQQSQTQLFEVWIPIEDEHLEIEGVDLPEHMHWMSDEKSGESASCVIKDDGFGEGQWFCIQLQIDADIEKGGHEVGLFVIGEGGPFWARGTVYILRERP